MSLTIYQYKPLDANEFRLLWLEKVGTELVGRVLAESIDNHSEYYALSWTWPGVKDASPQSLTCDGASIEVCNNLAGFLYSLTEEDLKLPFWIDAICINQNDETDKAAQIPLMGKIYSQAVRTIVWLGSNQGDGAAAAMEALPEVNAALSKYSFDPRTSHLSLNRSMPRSLILHMMGICAIALRSWFTRIWTMQEFVLAKEVSFMYGQAQVPEEVLGQFIYYYNGLNYRANEALMKPEMFLMMFSSPDDTTTGLIKLDQADAFKTFPRLQTLRESRAALASSTDTAGVLRADLAALILCFEKCSSLSVDKILGLTGMLQSPDFKSIPIKVGVTDVEVFTVAAAAVLTQQDTVLNFTLLHYLDTVNRRTDIPSWVPNFDSPLRVKPLSPFDKDGEYIYSASSDVLDTSEIRVQFPITENAATLSQKRIQIRGRFVDEIVAHIPGHDSGWLSAMFATFFGPEQEKWERRCNDLARAYARGKFTTRIVGPSSKVVREYTNQPIKDYPFSYYTTLVAGSAVTGKTYKRATPSEQTYKEFKWRLARLAEPSYEDVYERLHNSEHPGVKVDWDLLVGKSKEKDWTKPLYIAEEKEEYHARMFEVCRGRSFFVTRSGRLGLGGMVENGDRVVVLNGARTPYVVRPIIATVTGESPAEGIDYQLVGEAYVYGLMDREAYHGVLGDMHTDVWITLV